MAVSSRKKKITEKIDEPKSQCTLLFEKAKNILPFLAFLISSLSLWITFGNQASQREKLEFTIDKYELIGAKVPISISLSGRIVNVSDVDISLKRVRDGNDTSLGSNYRLGKLSIDGFEDTDGFWAGIGLTLPANSNVKYEYSIPLTTINAVRQFSEKNTFKDQDDFLSKLCHDLKMDYHGDALNDGQISMCPSFHLFSSEYNSWFSESDGVAYDIFWFEAETYRGNVFRSFKYKPELGGSAL